MKPWQIQQTERLEIPVPLGMIAQDIDGDGGPRVRMMPAPSDYRAADGGGRPTGDSVDGAPINYSAKHIEDEYGIRDNEELYAPPSPEAPQKPGQPVLPQEFEATWQERYMRRTGAVQAKPSGIINTEAFLRPEKGVIAPRKPAGDPVLEKLQEQIAAREQELAREKRGLLDFELRTVVVDGAVNFLHIQGESLRVLRKSEAVILLGQLLQ